MTIIFLNFLKSLINRAKNVNEIVKLNPNSSGTTEPKTIPRIVDTCQIVQQVKPSLLQHLLSVVPSLSPYALVTAHIFSTY